MTNFEKWKQDLTPGKLSRVLDYWLPCVDCPAHEFCQKLLDKEQSNWTGCNETIKKWSDMEVKE